MTDTDPFFTNLHTYFIPIGKKYAILLRFNAAIANYLQNFNLLNPAVMFATGMLVTGQDPVSLQVLL